MSRFRVMILRLHPLCLPSLRLLAAYSRLLGSECTSGGVNLDGALAEIARRIGIIKATRERAAIFSTLLLVN